MWIRISITHRLFLEEADFRKRINHVHSQLLYSLDSLCAHHDNIDLWCISVRGIVYFIFVYHIHYVSGILTLTSSSLFVMTASVW